MAACSVSGCSSHCSHRSLLAEVRAARTPYAVIVFVLSNGADATHRYDVNTADASDTAHRSVSTLHTAAGSVIEVADVWTMDGDAHHLRRDVTVSHVGPGDTAFATGAEFDAPAAALAAADVFVPGVWYGSAEQTPLSGLIHDVGQSDFLIREDRTALPLVSVRDRAGGRTLMLSHDDPDGGTIAADARVDRLINARLRFGSIGLRREQGGPLRLAFRFPGTECEQTSIGGFQPARRTAERLHPLVVGATQHYELTLRSGDAGDLAEQLRDAWRDAFARARPAPVPFSATAVYDASVGVLAHYAYDQGNASGFPFSVKLPGGQVRDRSLQMGFVGQQLPWRLT